MRLPFRLSPELPIDVWLAQYDSQPRVVPLWPESSRMALVVVIVDGFLTPEEAEPVGYAVTKPAQVDEIINFVDGRSVAALFFMLPKAILLRDGGCPELNETAWQ